MKNCFVHTTHRATNLGRSVCNRFRGYLSWILIWCIFCGEYEFIRQNLSRILYSCPYKSRQVDHTNVQNQNAGIVYVTSRWVIRYNRDCRVYEKMERKGPDVTSEMCWGMWSERKEDLEKYCTYNESIKKKICIAYVVTRTLENRRPNC